MYIIDKQLKIRKVHTTIAIGIWQLFEVVESLNIAW
jgi:hypothetical protein